MAVGIEVAILPPDHRLERTAQRAAALVVGFPPHFVRRRPLSRLVRRQDAASRAVGPELRDGFPFSIRPA